ncbi:tripartite tricarboxylate transporter substrate binding protein [Pigmentiphaga sp.]|uniref:Bug family tripartite tricarboxylate transporter substrate binding protein n=1 Tax=Pigmentiphaga sp. TaxID=1977564 RepID=UPI0025CFCCCA|nr:tripartite tricarboxylate transporter substrate binding protein [Pigmentiphaga sp.]MBX6317498.1 tripartite tricarboxylate transporter substrate binding protein [Pigmentiphaga sp.]
MFRSILAMGALALAPLSAIHAQEFPNRPIRLVVPYPAGGAMDVSARVVAQELNNVLKQAVIVENRAGGAGTLAADYVSKAKPDGYTLCWCPTGPLVITPLSDATVPYDPLKDLAPVNHTLNFENVLMARKDLPASDMKQLLELGRNAKEPLTYSTPGAGGTHHLGGEWLKKETGLNLMHVPYKGENPAVTAVMAGQIDMAFASALIAAPAVKDGRAKLIANVGPTRSKLLPDLPTVSELGFPNYAWVNFVGVNAPAGTPPAIIEQLSKAIAQAARTPAVENRLAEMGITVVGGGPTEYEAFLRKEMQTWGNLLKTTNVTRE